MKHHSAGAPQRERERERGASSAWWRKLRSVYLVLLLMKFYSLIPFRKIFTIFEYFSCLKVLFLASHKNLIKKKFEEDLPKKKSWLHILKILQHCLSFHAFSFCLILFYFVFPKKEEDFNKSYIIMNYQMGGNLIP